MKTEIEKIERDIEDGFAAISLAIYKLIQNAEYKLARNELESLISLFNADLQQLMIHYGDKINA